MALLDINFQESEGQDFILEIVDTVYSGDLTDILTETESDMYPNVEIPPTTTPSTGNIFIMSE